MSDGGAGLTLLILAAGQASRFGRLKQLESVGPHGEAIMEYSIHDALAAGFHKIVLVIQPEHEQLFRDRIVRRLAGCASVAFVRQRPEVAVKQRSLLRDRTKPWGTAHAILAARDVIGGRFAVLNADDLYGASALQMIASYLATSPPTQLLEAAMVGYKLRNTLSEHGAVARGVCAQDPQHYLKQIVEYRKIVRHRSGKILAEGNNGPKWLYGNECVSLNLWGFPASIFERLEEQFALFLSALPANEQEFEISTVVGKLIERNELRVRVLETDEEWCGVTYQGDVAAVRRHIALLVANGRYASPLWSVYEQR